MGGFLNRLGKTLEQGAKEAEKVAAKAQFEADKVMRANRAKGEVEALKQQREKTLTQLGQETLTLVMSRQIDHPTLNTIVDQVKGLDGQIAAKEASLQAIHSEQYAVPEPTKTAPASAPATTAATPPTAASYTPPASSQPASIPSPYTPSGSSAPLPSHPEPSETTPMGTTTGTTGSAGIPGEGQVQQPPGGSTPGTGSAPLGV